MSTAASATSVPAAVPAVSAPSASALVSAQIHSDLQPRLLQSYDETVPVVLGCTAQINEFVFTSDKVRARYPRALRVTLLGLSATFSPAPATGASASCGFFAGGAGPSSFTESLIGYGGSFVQLNDKTSHVFEVSLPPGGPFGTELLGNYLVHPPVFAACRSTGITTGTIGTCVIRVRVRVYLPELLLAGNSDGSF